MTGQIDLGADYSIDEDSTGDFVISHATNGDLLKYDESADRITILKADEKIQDVVDALLVGGTNITLTYDDAGNSLTIDAAGTTDTRTDVSDSGTLVVSDTSDINFDANLTVTDDTDGTVTVDASSSTDTTTDVSDGGVTVVNQTDDINFTESGAATVNVTDDGDGSATVNVDTTDTDTRTDVSDDGTQIVVDTSDINFSTNLSVTDDGDGSVTVSASAPTSTGVDSPKVFTRAELANAESIEHDIPVNPTETLTIYRWGVHRTSDDTAPTGLDVELADAADTTQTAANTVDSESATGVASLSNSSGTLSIYTVKLKNDTGVTEEVAGHFAYIVE